MMEQTVKYFDEKGLKYEIILVNDGSKDKTWELMQSLITNKYPKHEIYSPLITGNEICKRKICVNVRR